MPTELCKSNIDLFAREVLPHLAGLWDDKYEDRWWPERLRAKRPVTPDEAEIAANPRARSAKRLSSCSASSRMTGPASARLRI